MLARTIRNLTEVTDEKGWKKKVECGYQMGPIGTRGCGPGSDRNIENYVWVQVGFRHVGQTFG